VAYLVFKGTGPIPSVLRGGIRTLAVSGRERRAPRFRVNCLDDALKDLPAPLHVMNQVGPSHRSGFLLQFCQGLTQC
jgi:hypothetical protein